MKKIIAISLLTLIGFNAYANDNAKRLIELLIKDDISVFKNVHIAQVNITKQFILNSISNSKYRAIKICQRLNSMKLLSG